jgi:hypothetical protein
MVLPERKDRTLLLIGLLLSVGFPDAGLAQGRPGCATWSPPTLGAAFGRSSPYLEGLVRGAVGLPASGSVLVEGGFLFVGRADVPVAGPLRLRIEGGTARWDVRHVTYDPDGGSVTSDRSAGQLSVHHVDALASLRTGRAPVCAQLSVGGGLYRLAFGGASVWRPGTSLAAGIEIPTGERGAIQAEAVLHLIATGGASFIASSTVPALNVVVGWAYRF